MLSVFSRVAAFSVFLSLVPAANAVVPSNSAVISFEKKFRDAVAKNNVPGAAYAIIEKGKIVAIHGVGKRALGATLPVDKKTVFRLASVSKTFSAELAAMLIAEGKFSWDDKVLDYVPAFKLQTRGHAGKLRIDHLLSHTSGLTPNAYDNMLEDGWSLSKIIPRFGKLKPICKPGVCYGYQNILFSFIKPVIEKTNTQSFETLMETRIFDPLGMDNSSIGFEGYLSSANRAAPHVFTRKGWYRTTVKPNYYNVAPAAGVNASIEDLAKWVRAQMGYNDDVLNEALLKIVTTKRVKTVREKRKRAWRGHLSEAHYGYGWRIYKIAGEEVIMHGGGVSGFRSLIAYSKERDIGVVILMNAETRSIDKLAAEFWTEVASQPRKGSVSIAAR
ncbi:MAG: beta-lactamase family protein [Kordiimonadaceae bacterium]|nr:beta-lactamase family protein [Kordiimonadaceae bacterium]